MKASYELERVSKALNTNEDTLKEIEQMPDEKVAMLYACAAVRNVICDECGEETWLIGSSGHNSQDSCHHCGERYKVVG